MEHDNLPNTPLSQIDWGFITAWRIATIFIIVIFVFQMVVMMSHYWHRMIPLRREIEVIAPPIRWTFAYHLVVTVTVAFVGVGLAQQVYFNARPTIFTILAPILLLALTVVANRFLAYYSRTLNEESRRSHFHR